MQFNARLVEDAIQREFDGQPSGRNRILGQPGLWRVLGMGSRKPNGCPRTIAFVTYAYLKVPLDHSSSDLFLNKYN